MKGERGCGGRKFILLTIDKTGLRAQVKLPKSKEKAKKEKASFGFFVTTSGSLFDVSVVNKSSVITHTSQKSRTKERSIACSHIP